MSLDFKYQLLIYTFIASIPIHGANLLITHTFGLKTLFAGLVIVAIGLVILFGHLQALHRPRTFTQNILTLGNLILVAGSTINLITHGFGL